MKKEFLIIFLLILLLLTSTLTIYFGVKLYNINNNLNTSGNKIQVEDYTDEESEKYTELSDILDFKYGENDEFEINYDYNDYTYQYYISVDGKKSLLKNNEIFAKIILDNKDFELKFIQNDSSETGNLNIGDTVISFINNTKVYITEDKIIIILTPETGSSENVKIIDSKSNSKSLPYEKNPFNKEDTFEEIQNISFDKLNGIINYSICYSFVGNSEDNSQIKMTYKYDLTNEKYSLLTTEKNTSCTATT